ncbi:MAG: hypothetical protein JXB13_12450 [Phycisphaerae bacterium]|nr:hypothetical protein [Phycisphaerae bacterium]
MRTGAVIVGMWCFISSAPAAEEVYHTFALEAEAPVRQQGSQGDDRKAGASGGAVLGMGFGADPGDFAEYTFPLPARLEHARLEVWYARGLSGWGEFDVTLDGNPVGRIRYTGTGGWGDRKEDFAAVSLNLPPLEAAPHTLRLTVVAPDVPKDIQPIAVAPAPVCDRVGGRPDKNSVGHGRNVALYTGAPSQFFYATYHLGNVFDAADGATIVWYPDHVQVSPDRNPAGPFNVNLDRIIITDEPADTPVVTPAPDARPEGLLERRQVCVTPDDVIVARIHWTNATDAAIQHTFHVSGDCRDSRDWRGKPGDVSLKAAATADTTVTMVDGNVYPELLPHGLAMVIGASAEPDVAPVVEPGRYRMGIPIALPPKGEASLTVACAIHPDLKQARANLEAALRQKDPIAANRRRWESFFEEAVPRFRCSDAGLEELYAFRWFLLRFSTAGGDLGYFKYPVVLEGRQAYQTYCCYSAPFMAFDMNWAVDPMAGFGHIASMGLAAHNDGRFPWYVSPNTNEVPIHHRSGTGMSLLPLAAWRHYTIHRRKDLLEKLYPAMKKNLEWWIADRDADGDGLFVIDHQLETGMDDLKRWPDAELRYDAIDATSYAVANLRALAAMASVLGEAADAARFDEYAERSARAVNDKLWSSSACAWRDRHPTSHELANVLTVTTFYPWFAGIGGPDYLCVFRDHLLNPKEFRAPYPVPALAINQENFSPTAFWEGPSWPAATSHVIEAFAMAAKTHDRSLLAPAGELFQRAARNHLQPRADFYERYNPLTGQPLSTFRDYMHSWWVDGFVRHVAGLMPQDDGSVVIDPLPMGLTWYCLENVPVAGHRVDVEWHAPGEAEAAGTSQPSANGLTVHVDGKPVLRKEDFRPGDEPVRVPMGNP